METMLLGWLVGVGIGCALVLAAHDIQHRRWCKKYGYRYDPWRWLPWR